MPDQYRYTIDSLLTNPDNGQMVPIKGSFSVDYDAKIIYNSSITVGNISFLRSDFNQTDLDGATRYNAFFENSIFRNDRNSLIFNYDEKSENTLMNVFYSRSQLDLTASPATNVVTVLRSDAIPVSSQVVCFVTGALIQTASGEVAVEDLRIGDHAVTASGGLRSVTWIGHRDLDGAGNALPHDQRPVRIRAGAFGAGIPARDLCLSPGHPVLVGADEDGAGGHLVPIMCLINGTSITREPVASVTYWHVELDAHDILLAEGLAAESYLDRGDRPFFDEAFDHALHNPDFVVPGLSARCRPVAVEGPVVEAERARLSAVFAASLGAACAWDEAERFAWLAS